MSGIDFHNRGGLAAFLASLVFVFVFFLYIVGVNSGVDLAEKVSEPEVPGAIKFDLASVSEPWVSTPEIVEAGNKIYQQNCAVCHGAKGDLVGGIANARNLIEGQWKMGGGHIGLFKVLQNGIAGTQMASFKAQLNKSERWAVVHFVNSITQNKPEEKPEDVASFAQSAD